MRKITSIATAFLLCASLNPFSINAAEETQMDLKALASSLGADTDLLKIPNYYCDEERPVPESCYEDWLSKTTTVEYARYSDRFNSAANAGHCYGISVIEALCHNGVISPSDIQAGAETLSDVVYTDEVNKLLTDYQALQAYTEYDLLVHYLLVAMDLEEQVDRALEIAGRSMTENRYFVIVFQTDRMVHAVTGMGVADGSWTFGDNTYDKCILTHDSNGVDADGNTVFNEKGCIYIDSSTSHVYIPAYDIDSDGDFILAAIDDDTFMNYKGAINPSAKIDYDVENIKKFTVEGPNRIDYGISFFDSDGNSLPLGEYFETAANLANYYFTKADKIVSETLNYEELAFLYKNNFLTNDLVLETVDARIDVDTKDEPSRITLKDNTCNIVSTNGEKLHWWMTYALNEETKNSGQFTFIMSGDSSDVTIQQKDNGFLFEGDINGKYMFSTLGQKLDENGNRVEAYGNQYVYEFDASQNVFIAYDDNGDLGLYIDPDGDGVYDDKVQNGDVNCDGYIDASDATGILAKYAEISTTNNLFTDLGQIYDFVKYTYMNYDYNNDGKIDASDASDVLGVYASNSTQ